MSVPKLSFRTKPLKMPVEVTGKKIEIKVVDPAASGQSNRPDKVTAFFQNHYRLVILIFLFLLGVISVARVVTHAKNNIQVHTVKKINCKIRKRIASCNAKPNPADTFVVEMSDACAKSVYEVGGVPFSAAKVSANIFKVPAVEFKVKNVVDTCRINAYVDSTPVDTHAPFTWVTTAQHRRFTLKSGENLIAYEVSASLFDSETNGRWIAYSFDVPETVDEIKVTGDGTDIIHVYAPNW